ncbi:MAG: triosephosphate isomerase [Patescibacteria group bacterium]|nr:MAG: triosephosphate isomerase [Patescibacteria group bacterium]
MKKLLISNFKSNKSVDESNEWLDELVKTVDWNSLGNFEVGVAPAFPSVEEFSHRIMEAQVPLKLTTQDLSAYPAGSYTGAVSARNLADLHVKYAIVGHSERRRYFEETSELVAMKVVQALDNHIIPLVCIDEPYLEEQIKLLDTATLSKCVYVYEPLSAIGTGDNVGVGKVAEVFEKITKLCGDVRCMYGGSVTDQNVSEYLLIAHGVLVGSFSLKANDFAKLVATATAL